MKIIQPETSEDFEKYYLMRWQILRQPLGLPRGSEKDAFEDVSFHIIACDDGGDFLGVAKLKPYSEALGQISHVAVSESSRGQGVGKNLIKHLELEARRRGLKGVFLTAREYNIPYFAKLGFSLGEEEIENNPLPDIKIFKMKKPLS